MNSNFSFLEEQWPELAQLGEIAESYLYSDANSSIMKSGMLGEMLVGEIYGLENMVISPDTQIERIQELEDMDIIPENVARALSVVRKNRNRAVHEGLSSQEHANNSLQAIFTVCVWFMEVYGNYEFVARPFVAPENISLMPNYREIIDEQEEKIERLRNKLAALKENQARMQVTQNQNVPLNVGKIYIHSNDSIDVLNMSVRSNNALRRAKFFTVGMIKGKKYDELMLIRNLGKKSVLEILDTLSRVIFIDNQVEQAGYLTKEDKKRIVLKYFQKRDFNLGVLKLSERASNGLTRNNIDSFSKLVNLESSDLLEFRGVGVKAREEILEVKKKIEAPIYERIESGEITEDNVTDLLAEDIDREVYDAFMNSAEEQLSISEIANIVPEGIEFGKLSASLGRLVIANKILLNMNGTYTLWLPSIRKVAECIDDARAGKILQKRLSGKTLEEIGSEYGITRERTRQIQNQALVITKKYIVKQYGLNHFLEDRYAEINSWYSIPKEAWLDYIKIPRETYEYFDMYEKKEKRKKELAEALDDNSVPVFVKQGIQDYLDKDCFIIDGIRVSKSKSGLEEYIITHKCKDVTTLEEFMSMYATIIDELGLSNNEKYAIKEGEERTRENSLHRSGIVLFDQGKRFRYYDMRDKSRFSALFDTLALEEYHKIEISTEKLFVLYPELMDEYDIRNGNELHYLIRSTYCSERNPELVIGRMPMIKFGDFDRNIYILQMLYELAPISQDNLATIISEELGVTKQTILANWLTAIDKYYYQGMYRIDIEAMPQIQQDMLLNQLKDNFYYIDEIREYYMDNIPGANEVYFNAFSLKNMGFLVYQDYVIRNNTSAQDFFKSLFDNDRIFNVTELNRKFGRIQEYSSTYYMLRKNYSIVEIEPGKAVAFEVLENLGITKDMMRKFCDAVCNFVGEEYFTIKSLRDEGFSFSEMQVPYGDWFYASILREDDRLRNQRAFPQIIFKKTDERISRKAMIIETINEEEVLNRSTLIKLFNQIYGIEMDNADIELAISDSEIYYDKASQQFYASYGLYRRMKRNEN